VVAPADVFGKVAHAVNKDGDISPERSEPP